NTVTVACADTTYSGAGTVCFYNTTVGTGCPSGATQTASSNWVRALRACLGTTKRCLFKRGDTFTAAGNSNYNIACPSAIGAYGSGAKPIISLNSGITWLEPTGTTFGDFRAMDLDIRGG